MFIELSMNGKNQWWRYLIVMFLGFAASQTVGSAPLLLLIVLDMVGDPSMLKNPGAIDLNSMTEMMNPFNLDFNKNLILAAVLFSFLVGLVSSLLLIKPFHNRSWRTVITSRAKIDYKRMLTLFIIWGLLTAISAIIGYIMAPDDFELTFNVASFVPLFLISILLIPIQCAAEEVLFRGYLLQGIGSATKSKLAAMIITSLLFAGMHMLNPEVYAYGAVPMFATYFLMGLMLAVVTVMDNGLEMAIGIHAANNFMAAVFFNYENSALPTDALYTMKMTSVESGMMGIVVFGVISILAAKFLYKLNFSTILSPVSRKY